MNELNLGEKRYINEATGTWNMLTNQILDHMEDVPEEVTDRISELDSRYKEEFREYFMKVKQAKVIEDNDDVLMEFDAKWLQNCPDFYNFRKLFAGCNPEDLKRAEGAFQYAESYFE
ncbi:MAG: hypothetical protein K5989_04370 [Lachnospiraceae bacterium]|nr:hypothetical protein [Lachnospiraceae bacterium]